MRSTLLAACAVIALTPFAARADIIFTPKDTGGIGEINILFDQGPINAITITGEVDHSGALVDFTSLTGQILHQEAAGQADIEVLPNPGNTLMTSMDMHAVANTAWGDVIIDLDAAGNPCGGGTNTCGTALITATDNFNHTFQDVISNGTNFVTMQTVAGTNEFITDVQVTEFAPDPTTGTFGWTSFKQPRVSGVCELVTPTSCTPLAVPEPSALLAFLAAGLGTGFWWGVSRWLRGRQRFHWRPNLVG